MHKNLRTVLIGAALLPLLTACGVGEMVIGEVKVTAMENSRYTFHLEETVPVPNVGESPMEGQGLVYVHFSDNRENGGELDMVSMGDGSYYRTVGAEGEETTNEITLDELNSLITAHGVAGTLNPWISRYGPNGDGPLHPNASNPISA